MPTAQGKLYVKDTTGAIVQILPEAAPPVLLDYQGATESSAGVPGLVPAAMQNQRGRFLRGDGEWAGIDASAISSGTIDIERLPKGALERLVIVQNEAERYTLTQNDIQIGDTVKQMDTGAIYYVTDPDHLDSAAGYVEYTAGAASSVAWTGVTDKPQAYPPEDHAHGNISAAGILMSGGAPARNSSLTTDATGKIVAAAKQMQVLVTASNPETTAPTGLDSNAVVFYVPTLNS